jgi:trans-aconitate 2-methyltransferase
MSEVANFYDDFSDQQSKVGINNRHLSIIDSLEEFGLKKNHKVLEIGCGIGTVSELILRSLSRDGFLHSIDISPRSIDLAKVRLKKYENVIVEVKDLTTEMISGKFDVIVLPDVIEHIPLNLHTVFFKNVKALLKDNGFVFIHIPHPNNLEWMVDHHFDGLQIIDQPIFSDQLCNTVYPLGFYLHHLKSYSVYCVDDDYQVIILKKKPDTQNMENLKSFYLPRFYKRLTRKIKFLGRGFK